MTTLRRDWPPINPRSLLGDVAGQAQPAPGEAQGLADRLTHGLVEAGVQPDRNPVVAARAYGCVGGWRLRARARKVAIWARVTGWLGQ